MDALGRIRRPAVDRGEECRNEPAMIVGVRLVQNPQLAHVRERPHPLRLVAGGRKPGHHHGDQHKEHTHDAEQLNNGEATMKRWGGVCITSHVDIIPPP